MSVSFGQHAKTLLMQLKQSDWLPEYNTPTVRSALSEANALSKEITDTLKEMNYEIKDASVAARKRLSSRVFFLFLLFLRRWTLSTEQPMRAW